MKKENFNQNWLFSKEKYSENYHNSKFTEVTLPHANELVDLNYFDDEIYKYEYFYLKKFNVDSVMLSKRTFIEFDGVMSLAKVYINGKYLGAHKGGYTRFTFELTKDLTVGENEIVVVVDSREISSIPPFGYAIDYLTFGGIYRDVTFITTSQNYISDIYAVPEKVLEDKKQLTVNIKINATVVETASINVKLTGNNASYTKNISKDIVIGENNIIITLESLENIELWDIESPNLYTVEVKYDSEKNNCTNSVKIGFKEAKFTEKGFYLNNKKLKIRGLNRHQSYPFVGYAMPKRVQEKDADILKYDLGLNLARTSHYPQSQHFLNRCDEIGLLVFEEIPGWQHVGDEKWQDVSIQNVREMITTDRNHASIILWGVRINESNDYHDFYTKTNGLAHELDSVRQTGGVRCITNSELLEDVYTMNEFIHTGHNELHRPQKEVTGLDIIVPYLVTEFGGHMCPTKSFDGENRALEYMRRHMEMHNDIGIDDEICGGIGWCAFDYYTHNNFGSGDKICYHGVSDMFRLPKFAGLFYKSQRNPKDGYVLEAATRWAVGDRNGGGISPLTVLTNCDYIKVSVSGKEIGTYYPSKEKYAGLEYPPCVIEDFNVCWGEMWGSATFAGFINNKEVISKKYSHNPLPTTLYVKADDNELIADGADATRVVVKALDDAENILPFFMSPITITVEGQGELIGDKCVSLQGGVYAFWIKTTHNAGTIKIKVENPKLTQKQIKIKTKIT